MTENEEKKRGGDWLITLLLALVVIFQLLWAIFDYRLFALPGYFPGLPFVGVIWTFWWGVLVLFLVVGVVIRTFLPVRELKFFFWVLLFFWLFVTYPAAYYG